MFKYELKEAYFGGKKISLLCVMAVKYVIAVFLQ